MRMTGRLSDMRRPVSTAAAVMLAVVAVAPAAAHVVDIRKIAVEPGKLTYGLALSGRPLAYREDGKLKGFEVELARAIAASSGIELSVVRLGRGALIEALNERRVDFVNTGALGDVGNDGTALVPYLLIGDHMMVLRGNPFRVRGPDDLSGGVASVTAGTTAEAYAREINARLLATDRAPVHIHSFPALRFTPFPVVMGHAQAYFVSTRTAIVTNMDPEAKARLVDGVFHRTGVLGFAVRKDNPDMVDALTHGIARMVSSGKYDALREAHGLPLELSAYR